MRTCSCQSTSQNIKWRCTNKSQELVIKCDVATEKDIEKALGHFTFSSKISFSKKCGNKIGAFRTYFYFACHHGYRAANKRKLQAGWVYSCSYTYFIVLIFFSWSFLKGKEVTLLEKYILEWSKAKNSNIFCA